MVQIGNNNLRLQPSQTPRMWGPVDLKLNSGELPFKIAQALDDDEFAVLLETKPQPSTARSTPLELITQDPVTYLGKLHADQPALFVFNESYSPRWRVVDVKTGKSIADAHWKVNGFANGFWLSRPGDYEFRIEYTGQDAARRGWQVTWWSWGICVALLLGAAIPWRRR